MWGNDKDREQTPIRHRKAASTVDTLVGRQTQISGDIRFSGGLHVDGLIKGQVITDDGDDGLVSISETGAVEGDVRVPHVLLNGRIQGNVHCTQRITLSAKAKVDGDVHYRILEMSSGAIINGRMVYEADAPDKLPAHAPEARREDDATAASAPLQGKTSTWTAETPNTSPEP